ncbi:MAG TPA: hypothetical protein VFC42_07175 [Methylomirabilota bacterium]|nr:hypothetical protein [Methylomirabilota bacterium]
MTGRTVGGIRGVRALRGRPAAWRRLLVGVRVPRLPACVVEWTRMERYWLFWDGA